MYCNLERGDLLPGRRSKAPGFEFQLGSAYCVLRQLSISEAWFHLKDKGLGLTDLKALTSLEVLTKCTYIKLQDWPAKSFFVLDDVDFMLNLFSLLSTN